MQATIWLEAVKIHAIIFCIMTKCSLAGGYQVSQEYTAYIFIVNFYLEYGGNVGDLRFQQQWLLQLQAMILMTVILYIL